MQRYFVKENQWLDDLVTIIGEDAKHIAVVMRMKEGNEIICVHPNGQAAICLITVIEKNCVTAKVKEMLEHHSELPLHVTIVQGLPKGSKIDFILQKGTELGASTFQFFTAERSVVKWDQKKAKQKLVRYGKIVKEAAEQSHRNVIPTIAEVKSLAEVLKNCETADYILFADEELAKATDSPSLQTILQQIDIGAKVYIVIGPEGGITDNERALLLHSHANAVRFGPRILRTETAALYALSVISYEFEESN